MSNQVYMVLLITNAILFVFMLMNNRRLKKRRVKKQIESIRLNKCLKTLLLDIQKQRGMCSRFTNGEVTVSQYIEQQIKSNGHKINQLEYDFTSFLNEDVRWSNIRNDWIDLRSNIMRLTRDESFFRHNILIENILYMIGDIAFRGQNDINHNIDDEEVKVIWQNIPQTLEAMGQLRAIGSGVATSGECSQANKIKLRYLNEQINRNYHQVSSQLTEITNGMAGDFDLNKLNTDVSQLLTNVGDYLITPDTPKMSADQFFEQATNNIDTLSDLYDRLSENKQRQIEQSMYKMVS